MISDISSYKTIFKVSGPLILQMSSVMLMQIIDAIFLSRYSPEAVAAVITAGLAGWLIVTVFVNTAGFTSTLIAQYVGAGKENRAPEIIRSGIYFSVFSSCIVASFTLISGYLFQWAGHAPIVRQYETLFFNYLCWSAFFNIAGSAVAGYFSGSGKTTFIMVGQFIGLAVNTVLDYLLIFGNHGFLRLGVTGAAIATICGQAGDFIFLAIAYRFSIKKIPMKPQSAYDWEILKKLMRYGFPSGIRAFIDMLAWTIFPFFVGRIGTLELAASNIAFRINVIAIFPMLGLSIAISILAGQSQGAKQPELSSKIWRRGMLISLVFTGILGLTYLFLPHQYYSIFYSKQAMSPEYFASLSSLGVMMLKLMTIYCLFDSISIITLGLLQGAGDTRWTMIAAVFLYAIFFGALFWIDHVHGSVKTLWVAATAFTITQSFLWLARFASGKWKHIEIVEEPGI